MKKYFLEEFKKIALRMIIIMGIITIIAWLIVYPVLLIPAVLISILYGAWISARQEYEYQREADKKYISDLYIQIYRIAVTYKDAQMIGFNAFKKAFNEYCQNYPKDKETIELFTNHYQELKRMFKSLNVEVE